MAHDASLDQKLEFFFGLSRIWNQIAIRHANSITLSSLQRASVSLLAPAYSIAFAIEPLFKDHHLFAAELLQRPLLERIGVLNFLIKNEDSGLALWERGWEQSDKSRPKMNELIAMIPELANPPPGIETNLTAEEFRRQTLIRLHSVVHADPVGALRALMPSSSGGLTMVAGPMKDNPIRRQEVGNVTIICISSLLGATERVFPNAGWPQKKR
jgi:hypothetical protein